MTLRSQEQEAGKGRRKHLYMNDVQRETKKRGLTAILPRATSGIQGFLSIAPKQRSHSRSWFKETRLHGYSKRPESYGFSAPPQRHWSTGGLWAFHRVLASPINSFRTVWISQQLVPDLVPFFSLFYFIACRDSEQGKRTSTRMIFMGLLLTERGIEQ